MACSTTAVQLTVNQWVAGSNPATPVDKILILSYTMLVRVKEVSEGFFSHHSAGLV